MIFFFYAQISLADSLYMHGHYQAAQVEYQREFFLIPDLYDNQQKRLRYATSLLHTDEPRGLLELSALHHDFSNLVPEVRISMAKYYLGYECYRQAIELLENVEEARLLGYAYLLDRRLLSARSLFATWGDSVLAHEIDLYLIHTPKSPRTAALLSVFMPGAGEIYAGDAKHGVRDFLLNLGSGILLYSALKNKKYVDAALIFSLLSHRFYLGSITNAQRIADKTNERHYQAWLKTMKMMYFRDIDLESEER